MLTVEQALAQVLGQVRALPPVETPLAAALGRTLAEPIVSDIDSPPYDKSLVDGYAVRSEDLAGGAATLDVIDEIFAGHAPHRAVEPGTAARIMTGAPVPEGADSVVMIEQSTLDAAADRPRVVLRVERWGAGRNVLHRARSMRAGQVVLEPGRRLRAVEIGLLAEAGRVSVRTAMSPTVTILSTGDELVHAYERPDVGQIRNSNGPMLAALVRQAGGEPHESPIVRDSAELLDHAVTLGLTTDVLILSGGVSAGAADLVPAALARAGVERVFHKIQLRPGKPLWFGIARRPDPDAPPRLVFGLPGNPASSLVCFELFVRPALAALAGREASGLPTALGTLAAPFAHRGDRPTYFPAALAPAPSDSTDDPARPAPPLVRLLDWQGSADLATLAQADALAYFPAGDQDYEAGRTVTIRPLD